MKKVLEGRASIERSDATYTATYRIEKGIITVSTAFGTKATQLGSSPPEVLARSILGEMISNG